MVKKKKSIKERLLGPPPSPEAKALKKKVFSGIGGAIKSGVNKIEEINKDKRENRFQNLADTIEGGLTKVEDVVKGVGNLPGIKQVREGAGELSKREDVVKSPIALGGGGLGTLPKDFKAFPEIDVNAAGRSAGLTTAQTAGLAKEVGRRRVNDVANNLLGLPNTKAGLAAAGKSTTFKVLAGAVAGGFTIDKLFLSPNELAVWAAVDNIGSAIPFQLNDLERGFKDGSVTSEEATVLLDQADEHLENARKFIVTSTAANPKLWFGSKRLREANRVATEAVILKRQLIEGLIAGEQPIVIPEGNEPVPSSTPRNLGPKVEGGEVVREAERNVGND